MTRLQIYKNEKKVGVMEVDGKNYKLDTKDIRLKKLIADLWKRGPILKDSRRTKTLIEELFKVLPSSEERLGFLDEELPAEYTIVEMD